MTTIKGRGSFLVKAIGAAALIALADLLFYGAEPGWTLGAFALAWVAVLAGTRPSVRRARAARIALLAAAGFAAALIDDPGPLDWCLFWIALASAALLPQRRFRHAIGWAGVLLWHAIGGLATPLRDLGSGLVDQSQKMTVAARATAEKKAVGQRS